MSEQEQYLGSVLHSVTPRGSMAQCHPDKKAASRGMCTPCYKRWLKETPESSRPAIQGEQRKRARGNATCHPDKPHRAHGLCDQCYLSQWRTDNIDKVKADSRSKHLKSKYGMSEADYEDMVFLQGGSCAICGSAPADKKKLHIDHDHETGVVRGLLCHSCNWYLGKIEADLGIIQRIGTYIEAGRAKSRVAESTDKIFRA